MNILGLYAGHDANAALVRNGSLVAATEEERVSRKKHHQGTPDGAMRDVLSCGEPIVRMRQEAAVVAGKAGLYLT